MEKTDAALIMIKTSSWFTKLPEDHARIGISRGVPRRQANYRRYLPLNPGPWFKSVPVQEYVERYFDILDQLDATTVLAELQALAGDSIPTLLCWEAPPPNDQWCHRALVSAWLYDELGLEVTELGHEDKGFGWRHPKLHKTLVR
jgi:hypothetical protein